MRRSPAARGSSRARRTSRPCTSRSARSSSRMPMRPGSRSELSRALVVNALAAPLNVLLPTAVLIAGILLGAWWLAVVAVACWLGLAAHTFFDERAAEADALRAQRISEFLAGQEPAPALERRIAQEPDAAVRAALEAKGQALARLRERLERLKGQMDQVVA